MSTLSLRELSRKPVNHKVVSVLTLPVFVVFGSSLSLFGAFVGLAAGMNFGVNFPQPYAYGGLSGYEGAGLLGNMVGAGVASLVLIRLWVREVPLRKEVVITYICTWCVALVAQHVIALETREWSPTCIVSPIILTGIVAFVLQLRRSHA